MGLPPLTLRALGRNKNKRKFLAGFNQLGGTVDFDLLQVAASFARTV